MRAPAPPHPGKILREYMGEHTISSVAETLGVHRATLSRVLSANSAISLDLAIRLGLAFGTSPDLWVGLQLQHDLHKAAQIKRPKIQRLSGVSVKDKSVRDLRGIFKAPRDRKVSIEDMRVNGASSDLAAWTAMKPVGREFGSPDYERLEELDALAVQILGSLKKARRWLGSPNVALDGRNPEDVARTRAGCKRVTLILQQMRP